MIMAGWQASALLAIAFIALGGIALVVGPGAGIASADSWLRSVGGAADSARYELVARAYIDAYLVAGGVLLLAGALICGDVARRTLNTGRM